MSYAQGLGTPYSFPSNSEKHGHENKTCLASPHNLNCLIDSLKYLFPQNTSIRQPPQKRQDFDGLTNLI